MMIIDKVIVLFVTYINYIASTKSYYDASAKWLFDSTSALHHSPHSTNFFIGFYSILMLSGLLYNHIRSRQFGTDPCSSLLRQDSSSPTRGWARDLSLGRPGVDPRGPSMSPLVMVIVFEYQ